VEHIVNLTLRCESVSFSRHFSYTIKRRVAKTGLGTNIGKTHKGKPFAHRDIHLEAGGPWLCNDVDGVIVDDVSRFPDGSTCGGPSGGS
jgi:hypothetical protein